MYTRLTPLGRQAAVIGIKALGTTLGILVVLGVLYRYGPRAIYSIRWALETRIRNPEVSQQTYQPQPSLPPAVRMTTPVQRTPEPNTQKLPVTRPPARIDPPAGFTPRPQKPPLTSAQVAEKMNYSLNLDYSVVAPTSTTVSQKANTSSSLQLASPVVVLSPAYPVMVVAPSFQAPVLRFSPVIVQRVEIRNQSTPLPKPSVAKSNPTNRSDGTPKIRYEDIAASTRSARPSQGVPVSHDQTEGAPSPVPVPASAPASRRPAYTETISYYPNR